MPEKAGICTRSTTTVPLMLIFESPDLTKELDMNKLCQVLTRYLKKLGLPLLSLLQRASYSMVCLSIASFWKKKGLEMAKSTKLNIAFYERFLLTVEEAAVYFHIGYKKMRNMVKDYDGAKWILRNGNRIMIKREQFEKWLDNQSAI